MPQTATTGYLRFPTVARGTLVFVSEDDLWSVPLEGGSARRITADHLGVANPRLSPDGTRLAFTSDAAGPPEIHVMDASGGMARRLTWLGTPTMFPTGLRTPNKVVAWAPDGRVVFSTPACQPFSDLTMAYAVPADGSQPPEALPYGPVHDVSYRPGPGLGAPAPVVVGRNTGDPAMWKRYRGGTAGALWLDRHGEGEFEPLLRSQDIEGNLACPMWVGERVFFISDHEGTGNLYSCDLAGRDVTRHSDHDGYYARLATTDGASIVYQVAGELWRYDPETDCTARVEVQTSGSRTQRQARYVPADEFLGGFAVDHKGERLVLDSRGKLFSMGPWAGPVIQHGASQGVRYRLGRFLGRGTDMVVVSDAGGDDAIEVHRSSPSAQGQDPQVEVLELAGLGRPIALEPSPEGRWLAVVDHQNQLFLVDLRGEHTTRVVDESGYGPPADLAWSPDGAWLAYSHPASPRTKQIKLARIPDGTPAAVTGPEFVDGHPSFDPAGRYLYFLSRRTFDPVYDSLFFDLGFPLGAKPYLVTLQAGEPSPFLVPPTPAERPTADAGSPGTGSPDAGSPDAGSPNAGAAGGGPAGGGGGAGAEAAPRPVQVDLDGIADRVVEVPVPEARYEAIVALENKLLLLSRPPQGSLGRSWASFSPEPNGILECYDLVENHRETLLTEVAATAISGDRHQIAYTTGAPGAKEKGLRLRVVASAEKLDESRAHEPAGRRSGFVDLGRARVRVEPGAEWAQMVREAWRLQRDHFWVADMGGVDWPRVLARYLPLVDRVATRTELADVIWELQGELGTSHAYELFGEYREAPPWGQAFLGADLARDHDGRWVVAAVIRAGTWHTQEAPPLLTPGARVVNGTALLAVNGQPVPPELGPGPLLANQAGQPVELTIEGPGDAGRRTVVVPTLSDERPLRYRAWVEANRARTRQATAGRAGYVHIPDMGPVGWSEFHRSYTAEIERDALIVDIRFNGGGHVSSLVLEKLRRLRIGWEVPRRGPLLPYPEDAPLGPLVAITNELAGSDGDIFTHGFKLFGLGPVVGTRTWGGVIGISPSLALVDGTVTTQPEYAFWFDDVGWGVENYGSSPTEEVVVRPQDYAAGRDPQLERAIELVNAALAGQPPSLPSIDRRPSRALPTLPPRTAREQG
ncbi:MAG TPA: S41 family peptidase [Acidimicrobiales bacterium]|nr:S41 family peptidase [Acidimicrobiales bacterium]